MTEVVKLTGATSISGQHWKAINWQKVKAEVKRLQMRIAKAVREGKSANKVKALQWILSHSYSAKLLAVRRVTDKKGVNSKKERQEKTTWDTDNQRQGNAGTIPVDLRADSRNNGGYKLLWISILSSL